MHQHIEDAEKLLEMPIVFGEFGVSMKDERFNSEFQQTFMETVYDTFLSSSQNRDVGGGSLVWQLFPEGADHMDDGYAVVLARSPSTLQMVSRHSENLYVYNERKESSSPESDIHDEL